MTEQEKCLTLIRILFTEHDFSPCLSCLRKTDSGLNLGRCPLRCWILILHDHHPVVCLSQSVAEIQRGKHKAGIESTLFKNVVIYMHRQDFLRSMHTRCCLGRRLSRILRHIPWRSCSLPYMAALPEQEHNKPHLLISHLSDITTDWIEYKITIKP